jgi:hypothetical protein
MPKNEGGNFELCPEGNHIAVCVRVIDLGTQRVEYKEQIKHQRKVYIGWELTHELMQDERPFIIGKRFTLSSHEKSTLRKFLEAWRSKRFIDTDFGPGGFEIKNVLGAPCMLQVVHTTRDDREYANVESVGSLPKGQARPTAVNDLVYLSLEGDEFDDGVFASLTERMQETIMSSPEFQRVRGDASLEREPSGKTFGLPEDDSVDIDSVPF